MGIAPRHPARRRPAAAGRRGGGACRGDRRRAGAGIRQKPGRRYRRSGLCRRTDALPRRMGAADRGRTHRERQSGRDADADARADRRRRLPDPVQLPDLHAGAQDRPGLDRRQRGRGTPQQHHPDLRLRLRRSGRRGRPAAGTGEYSHHESRRRPGAVYPARGGDDHLDRQRRRRPGGPRLLQGQHRQAVAGTGRQDPGDRRARRRSRRGGGAHRRRQDLSLRPGLHFGRTALYPRRRA